MVRLAIIKLRDFDKEAPANIQRYLDNTNYRVCYSNGTEVWIAGEDKAGWTLDDYILPRLASGLYFGKEITYNYS